MLRKAALPVLAAGLLAVLAFGVSPAQESQPAASPVVVELFTSQGCNSCPPADAFLGELAQRSDVVALAFHVDYWDYIGWKDPYASPLSTQRQRAYAGALGLRMVYTPQMVIDGRIDAVGSHRGKVQAAIETAAATPKLAVVIEADASGGLRAIIPAAESGDDVREATVWLAFLDSERETKVLRGENRGRTLKEFNIVREWRQIGSWNGSALTVLLDAPGAEGDACAVIVQAGPVGPILGAAFMRLDGRPDRS